MTSKEEISPIRKQYLDIKRQYPNAIVFFRLGDFYETFDHDAEITSQELDIVLTSRSVTKGTRVPMAGVPYHAVENYLARLIERGYHVAICEQVGNQPVKGLFSRQVIRVVTPGTIVEPGLLQGNANNYLVSIIVQSEDSDGQAGIAYLDITTGEFAVTELSDVDILTTVRAELIRLHATEVLHPDTFNLHDGFPGYSTPWPAWRFELGKCQEVLLNHFAVTSLDGFGLRGYSLGIRAAGAILQYISETQPAALKLLSSLSTYNLNEFMTLDAATRRNMELTETLRAGSIKGSLLDVLDYAVTPMGSRLIRQWVNKPLLDINYINQRLDGVDYFFKEGLVRAELRSAFKSLGDMERLTTRIISGHASPHDLISLRSILQHLPSIIDILANENQTINDIRKNINPCTEELSLLESSLVDDPPATLQHIGIIRPGYSAELDGVVERSRYAREWIANLEPLERNRTGIKSLKVGYNRVFGYYIEVTRANAEMVPQEYIRKQTLVNAERYITSELKEYETLVLNAEERIREIEVRLFRELCNRLVATSERLLNTARALAQIDVLVSMSEAAIIGGYVRPEVVSEDVLFIRDGRHPVVEHTLKSEKFVPNDTVFEEGERIRIITGPNMSGKSTYIRQVALIVLMAQVGSFVPADFARIGIVDRIFTRIGAQDEIYAGQSTFMVEMLEMANILHHATPRSLLVLDEIGRGTSTYDGVSIAWSIVEYIHNHPNLRSKTLFATHYHELTQLAGLLPGVRNFNVAVIEAEGRVVFLHKIIPGGADRSYGIHVGQLAGLPHPVILRADEMLRQLESSSGKIVRLPTHLPQQMTLFPETNPLLDELKGLDINVITPIEALNKLFLWQKKYFPRDEK